MIKNSDGFIPVDQFLEEMKSRNLSLEDLKLLYEQYDRYNYMNQQTVKDSCGENKEVELKCYPVCECGHVFTDLEFIKNPESNSYLNPYSIPMPTFNPKNCPKCNKRIVSIAMKQIDKDGNINFKY
jgi:hypothetical protein